MIGDPPNILIGSLVGLDFNAFIIHLAPVIVVIMAVQALMFICCGDGRSIDAGASGACHGMSAKETILDRTLLRQSLVVLTAVIVGFVLARPLHLEPATIAIAGAATLMLLDNWQHHNETQSANVHKTFGDVEWITIFFFVGLFIVVHGVEVGGLLTSSPTNLWLRPGAIWPTPASPSCGRRPSCRRSSTTFPFVATMIPLIKSMAPAYGGADKIEPLWWCLSLGACLGGNGTLIGASANLTVAGIAERNGVPFRFMTYTFYGMPMMIVSIAIAIFMFGGAISEAIGIRRPLRRRSAMKS
jgi:Na+/H+ antiporter NhaD/arsenite permease-like protein